MCLTPISLWWSREVTGCSYPLTSFPAVDLSERFSLVRVRNYSHVRINVVTLTAPLALWKQRHCYGGGCQFESEMKSEIWISATKKKNIFPVHLQLVVLNQFHCWVCSASVVGNLFTQITKQISHVLQPYPAMPTALVLFANILRYASFVANQNRKDNKCKCSFVCDAYKKEKKKLNSFTDLR